MILFLVSIPQNFSKMKSGKKALSCLAKIYLYLYLSIYIFEHSCITLFFLLPAFLVTFFGLFFGKPSYCLVYNCHKSAGLNHTELNEA